MTGYGTLKSHLKALKDKPDYTVMLYLSKTTESEVSNKTIRVQKYLSINPQ